MKLTYFQLDQHLKSKLEPIYAISGDETLLKNDLVRALRRAVKQNGYTERKRFTPESQQDWEALYGELQSASLLAEKTLVEVDLRQAKLLKNATNLLKDYAANPNPDRVLILDLNKVDSKVAKSAWYQAISKHGVIIPVWPIPHEQIPRWIQERAKRYQLKIALRAVQLLADYVEGNLTAAAQTIEKLYLLNHEGEIGIDIIETILASDCHYTVFDFADAIIGRQAKRSLDILQALRADGIEPTLILWSITRELRALTEIKQEQTESSSIDALFRKHNVFARRQPLFKRFLSTTSISDCHTLLQQAAQIDQVIKGALPGNVWEALRLYCLRLA